MICLFMVFVDSKSHITTKPSNFDIKCHINFEIYDRHSFFGTKFRGGPDFFYIQWEVFLGKREYSEVEYPELLISDFQMPLIYGDNK